MSKSDIYAICMKSPTAWQVRDELLKALGIDEPLAGDMTPVKGRSEFDCFVEKMEASCPLPA